MHAEEFLKQLNPAQKEAVACPDGPTLILAGAGSGKTRALTYRIAYLIAKGVPPFHILGVTFTNKAANEMRQRVRRLVRHDVWISTFHSTCLRILRMEHEAAHLKRNFTIYDEHDELVLIKECLKELDHDERLISPKSVREAIDRAKDYLKPPQKLKEEAMDRVDETIAEVYERYEEKLKKGSAIDFGGLIMNTVRLFDEHPAILKKYQERFRYVLIDEYQDTNHAQYRLVKQLAAFYKNITVVGDPDQSIYAWRGADISNILNFEKDYPNARLIRMEQNYRSVSNVLDAANALIRHNHQRKHKDLWSENGRGEKIVLHEAADEKEEARIVTGEVAAYLDRGIALKDMVVFYRVHAQSRVLEEALRKRKLPYRIIGGVRFYDRKEIKDLIAYLRVIAFPNDDMSLRRILNVPSRGIGAKSIEALEAFAPQGRFSLNETIAKAAKIEGLGKHVRQSLVNFSLFLDSMRRKSKEASVSDMLKRVVEYTGYIRLLEEERTIEAKSRVENIKEFFTAVYEFEESFTSDNAATQLEAFIESITLESDVDQLRDQDNVLNLMTLHSAKGLEFKVVFMVGMEEEVFPHANVINGGDTALEEERRLCYVGITRAKERLHLSYADCRRLYGYRGFNLPSRFLGEIPSNLYTYASDTMAESCELTEDDEVFVKEL
ncbi:MAG: UvrD-helicase domain-containing protein [Candidatus Omnitrophica bacterium]|nr:UvrD-helicase domain-containing protein [Candidatus Omnitrophota bacterium]